MSQLLDWLTANTFPGGETTLATIQQAFTGTMSAWERRDWPRGRVEQELLAAGYRVEQRGRKDQPQKIVLGISFSVPAIDGGLQMKIVDYLATRLVSRYTFVSEPMHAREVCWDWRLTVTERDDYTPQRYTILYTDIAERLAESGIRANAQVVRVALEQDAKRRQTMFTSAGRWDYEEVEEYATRYVRRLTPTALIGYRWREEDDEITSDYFGPYVPPEGRNSLVTAIDRTMIGG